MNLGKKRRDEEDGGEADACDSYIIISGTCSVPREQSLFEKHVLELIDRDRRVRVANFKDF